MGYTIVRALLALMVVLPGTVVLSRPAAASVPLAVDVSDGYTFSGVQRTTKTGAIEEFFENPIGPFSVSGERGFMQLSWNVARSVTFLNCDPTQLVDSRSETIQNRQTNHYSVDLSGTSGVIESVYIGFPSFENAGIGTATAFPIDQVTLDILYYDDSGQQRSGTMTQTTPRPGHSHAFAQVGDDVFFGNVLYIDITASGEVEPELVETQTTSLDCPSPNEDLQTTMYAGLTQLFLNDPQVIVNVADAPANNPPVFDLQGTTTVVEGETASATLTVSDPDGDALQVDVPDIAGTPCLLNATDPSADVVEVAFDCPTTTGDAGAYPFTVTASDGQQTVSMDVVITVTAPEPAPSLDPVDDVIIDEGASQSFEVTGSNLDPNDTYTLTTNLPGFGSASPFVDGAATLSFNPGFDDAGTYTGTITLTSDSDPNISDTRSFTLTVGNVNRNPNLDPIGDVVIDEGDTRSISIIGGDADGDSTVIFADLPAFASAIDNVDGTGSITLAPTFDDAGSYTGSVSITDDGNPNLVVTGTFAITVNNVNRNPNLLPIDDVSLTEGDSRTIEIIGSDADAGDSLILTSTLPEFANLTDNGDGTGAITMTTNVGDAGTYLISVTLTDDGEPALTSEQSFILTVDEVEGPGVESYDELESLVIASVENRIVERLLVGTLNLAQFFDEELNLAILAVAFLRTFQELVDVSTPRWIDPVDAEVMIVFAQVLIENIIGP